MGLWRKPRIYHIWLLFCIHRKPIHGGSHNIIWDLNVICGCLLALLWYSQGLVCLSRLWIPQPSQPPAYKKSEPDRDPYPWTGAGLLLIVIPQALDRLDGMHHIISKAQIAWSQSYYCHLGRNGANEQTRPPRYLTIFLWSQYNDVGTLT